MDRRENFNFYIGVIFQIGVHLDMGAIGGFGILRLPWYAATRGADFESGVGGGPGVWGNPPPGVGGRPSAGGQKEGVGVGWPVGLARARPSAAVPRMGHE